MNEIRDNPATDRKQSGKRRRCSHRAGKNFRAAISYGLVGLALVVVVVFLSLQGEHRKKRLRDEVSIADLKTADATFDQIIERANINQLIEMSRELVDAPDDSLLMRLDRISKQVAISNRILQLNPDSRSRTYAISTKLKRLMDRTQIIAQQEIYTDATTAELRQFAAEYADSEEISVSSLAKTGVAVASISEFLSAGPTAQRAGLAIDAIENLMAASEFSSDDPGVATRLHDWLQIIKEQNGKQESQKFIDAWSRVYTNSGDSRIAKLVDQTENASELSQVELVNIFDSVSSDRDEFVEKLLEQVDAALKQSEISNATLLFVLQRTTELLAFGKLDDAKEIRRKITQSSIKSSTDPVNQGLAKLDSKLNFFESPIDLSSFTDFNSDPVKFNVAKAKFKILYFVSDLNNGEAMPEFTKLIETVSRELLNSNLEIVVVYLDRDDDSEGLEQIKDLAAQNQRWQVWILRTASPQGQSFLNRISLDKSPYIIVLGNDDSPIALDPSNDVIEELVFTKSVAQDE